MADSVDTPMSDAPGEPEPPQPQPEYLQAEVVQSIETDAVPAEPKPELASKDEAADGAEDAPGEDEAEDGDQEDTSGRPVTNNQYKALKAITEVLTDYKIKLKNNEDYYPSLLFKRVPNKRNLPDYYQIIKEPSAISTLKGKIQRKTYTGIPEFVRDFALVVHNAQVYNRPNSQPVRDVFVLDGVFKEELAKLVERGLAKEEEIVYPDLGEIPAATPEPDPVSEEEEEEDEGEEGEESEEGDESDGGRKGRRGRGGRKSRGAKGDDEDDDGRKRRGRPPKVDTPMEARIKAVIKGMRKPKDNRGMFRIRHFDRLPDKAEHPHYYQEIKEPIAMDTIKKKAKRKKYRSLDDLMRDFELMFRNAMTYNVESSEIYKDAVVLLQEAKALADAERARPDSEFALDDGRIPLPEGIEYKGEMWKVGDWIHIQNPNDVTKPIVAQIYRTWKDSDDQMWINACWYYRPEQTVHQFEKHFYPNEVVKTGQYRDHHIEEVMDRCFVMFFTRYNRGRPRNLDSSKEVYVCEARYNEEKHKFNKIKTWASCLPDEVRDKDYEMDLFDAPRRIKKQPSPIKHLLKDDAKESDPLPTPQWGNKNAPPIIGGIYKAPRDENQSPPPEPTPPPPPTPPAPVRAPPPVMLPHQNSHQGMPGAAYPAQQQMVRPSPSMTPHPSYQAASASPAPQYGRQPSYQQPTPTPYPNATPSTPAQAQPNPYATTQQAHLRQPSYSASHPGQYATQQQPQQQYQPRAVQPPQPQAQPQSQPAQPQQSFNAYNAAQSFERRAPEAYVLSDAANESIPKAIRERFPQDDQGRVLFFTKPPVDTRHVVRGKEGKPLDHSEEYMKRKAEREQMIEDKKRSEAQVNGHVESDRATPPSGVLGEARDPDGLIIRNAAAQNDFDQVLQDKIDRLKVKGIQKLRDGMINATVNEYLVKYGDNALRVYDEDIGRASQRRKMDETRDWERERTIEDAKPLTTEEDTEMMLSQDFWTGRVRDPKTGVWEGRFEDDYDNRLPR